jgi:hypothetical protein
MVPIGNLPRGERGLASGKENLRGLGAGAAKRASALPIVLVEREGGALSLAVHRRGLPPTAASPRPVHNHTGVYVARCHLFANQYVIR